MTPRAMDRLARLEANATPPTTGRHLIFRVETPQGTPVGEIIAFLKEQGHAIHEGDDVFLMNVGAYWMAEGEPLCDLSDVILTEADRGKAPAGGQWPPSCDRFTFVLDSPGGLQRL